MPVCSFSDRLVRPAGTLGIAARFLSFAFLLGLTLPAAGQAQDAKTSDAAATESGQAQVQAKVSSKDAKPSEPERPWSLYLNLSQNLGIGAFVSDSYARNPDWGYSVAFGGRYILSKLGEGDVSVGLGLGFHQSLTQTAYQGGTRPNEFYFHDLNLSFRANRLVTEPVTKIRFSAFASVAFPTSEASLNANRIMSVSAGGTASRTFEDVGPGNLLLSLSISARKDFGDVVLVDASSRAICRSPECLTGIAGYNWGFSPAFSVSYNWSPFSFGVRLSTSHGYRYNLSNTTTANVNGGTINGSTYEPRRSPFAGDKANYSLMTHGTISASYTLNRYVSFTAGIDSFQPIDIQNADGSRSMRFPFFDFESTADNFTSYFLDVSLSY